VRCPRRAGAASLGEWEDLWLLGTLVGTSLLWPTAALGADVSITVGPGKTLSPSGGSATINPDETVTWRWAAGSDKHQIASISSTGTEVWDSGWFRL
jgi:hypothetical protein